MISFSYNTTPNIQSFVYNADIGLRKWRAAIARLKAGSTEIVNLQAIGDSITTGVGATAPIFTNGYIGRIKTALTTKFGDVGRGFIPCYYLNGVMDWSKTGTWSTNGSYGTSGCSWITTENGATAFLTFNGTGIAFVMVTASACGTFDVAVDGGASTNYGSTEYNSARVYKITGLAPGDHTIIFTANTDGTKTCYLLGAYEIKGDTGIRVNMVGRSGILVHHAMDDADCLTAEIDIWDTAEEQLALTIIALGANDYDAIPNQTNLGTYYTQLETLISRAKSKGDVLILTTGLRSEVRTIPQSSYIKINKRLGLKYNCALIDIFDRWGGNKIYPIVDNKYVFDADTIYKFYATGDTVHPSDFGHQDIDYATLNVLLEDR